MSRNKYGVLETREMTRRTSSLRRKNMCEGVTREGPLWWPLSSTFSVTQTEALPETKPVFTEWEPCIICFQGPPLQALAWGQKRILLLSHWYFGIWLAKQRNSPSCCILFPSGSLVQIPFQDILRHCGTPSVAGRNDHPADWWEKHMCTSKGGWIRQQIEDTHLGHL